MMRPPPNRHEHIAPRLLDGAAPRDFDNIADAMNPDASRVAAERAREEAREEINN